MAGVLKRREDRQTRREDGYVMTEAKTRTMFIYKPRNAEDCQQIPETTRRKERSFPRAFREKA